jgi:hypothetical protein
MSVGARHGLGWAVQISPRVAVALLILWAKYRSKDRFEKQKTFAFCYSCLSAVIGSTRDARRAGT